MTPIAITALGMVTSIGRSASSACAAIRAGISAPRPIRYFSLLDADSQEMIPLTGYPVHAYTEGFVAMGRWVRLALGAVLDLLQHGELPDRSDEVFWRRTGLICLTPQLDPDRFLDVGALGAEAVKKGLRDLLLERTGLPVHADERHVLELGHTGAIAAVQLAERQIARGKVERFLVVGADSYLDELSLEGLAEQGRLKTEDRPDGLMPGEAGACALLESLASARRRKAPVSAMVTAAALDREPNHLAARKPNTGAGLAGAVRAALAGAAERFEGDLVIDLNGETWRAIEWGHARVRLVDVIGDGVRLVLPCGSLGDVGAASGVVALGITARSFARDYARGSSTVIVSSSERGDVGALVLRGEE